VVFGATLFESFMGGVEWPDGWEVPEPGPGEGVVGGHAMMVVGYDLTRKKPALLVRNSWGPEWGWEGYCLFPVRLFKATASDFWSLRYIAA
jgi:C1A family cysteine protease